MSAHTWTVEARVPNGKFDWSMVINRLSRDAADNYADRLAGQYDDWEIRLLNEATAQLVYYVREQVA